MRPTFQNQATGYPRKRRLLAASLVSSWIVIVCLLIASLASFKLSNHLINQELRQRSTEDRMLYLDEGLTMSARLLVLTGNRDWAVRYQTMEKEWDQNMEDLLSFGKSAEDFQPLAKKAVQTGYDLFTLENSAFRELSFGHPVRAKAILFSPQYETSKRKHRDALTNLSAHLEEKVALARKRNAMLSVLAVLSVFLLLPLTLMTVAALKALRQLESFEIQMLQASKMAALGEMASGIAHEVNNPLTAIIGRAGLLLHTAQTDHSWPRPVVLHSEAIRSTALRIAAIIRSLRLFAREDEHDPLKEVSVRDILNETLELCRERFRVHGIELKAPMPEADVRIQCHPVQISQAILNLLNNAYDALEGAQTKWVRLETAVYADSIEISVTDSGPGIPKHLQEKVLRPFFTTKPAGKGTGLGLSISQRLVEASEGSLWLDKQSKNTRFVIRFPISEFRTSKIESSAA
jgi:signal transduction histidine kinase